MKKNNPLKNPHFGIIQTTSSQTLMTAHSHFSLSLSSHASLTLGQALPLLCAFLQEHSSDAPSVAARLLCMHVLGLTKVQLITENLFILTAQQKEQLSNVAMRHAKGEPLAYIVGHKEFYGRTFCVSPDTLIPRPESEDVLDAALRFLHQKQRSLPDTKLFTFADVGTGSGCLACTLAAEMPSAQGIMLDISPRALQVATSNAKQLHVATKIHAVQGTLYHLPFAPNSLDVLISNPPYISEAEYHDLENTVRHFEPKTALVPAAPLAPLPSPEPSSSKATSLAKPLTAFAMEHNFPFFDPLGLCHIEALAKQAPTLLKKGGLCIVEHGYRQGKAVRDLFKKHGTWQEVRTGQDLAGLDRYCFCIKHA